MDHLMIVMTMANDLLARAMEGCRGGRPGPMADKRHEVAEYR